MSATSNYMVEFTKRHPVIGGCIMAAVAMFMAMDGVNSKTTWKIVAGIGIAVTGILVAKFYRPLETDFLEDDGGEDLFQPRMPEVARGDWREVFDQARKMAAAGYVSDEGRQERHIVIVTPSRSLMLHPCPPLGSMPADQIADIEAILPSNPVKNVVALAFNEVEALTTDIAQAIPLLGMLMGLAYIGHTVWVFEGHNSALGPGCRDADLMIIDAGMAPYLHSNLPGVVSRVMNEGAQIYTVDRTTFSLQRVH